MKSPTAANDRTPTRPLPVGRLLLIAVALMAAVAAGCSHLRLPAIDPTGSCLFQPLPTTTSLALPGSAGESCLCKNCLRGLGSCLKKPHFTFPTPAFPEPAPPPACPTPAPAMAPSPKCKGAGNEPCVPGANCDGSCQNGPPAVLLGEQCKMKDLLHLPKQGLRGCILLSPQKVVAPVGGEVVLLSGVCGTDGYLQMNEKLEWMLTPDSVGTFIQVGDDDPGIVHRLAGSKERPEKLDPSYAIGITSTKRTLITRGNLDARDDVQLEKGQTWITISSPSEGVSRVTVLAPESECWDQRKATATIYWVDARWQFPGPQSLTAGQNAELTTRVTRAEGGVPAVGWKVRYEILQPELASFAGTNNSSVVEAVVDEAGNATVSLIPTPGTSGTAAIDMQVIRPAGQNDNLPTITLGRGQTFVTWSAPQLALRAGGPSVATYDSPFQVVANVANPGDQPATNVRVDLQLPPGTRVTSADSFAKVFPNGVSWEIGTIPPQQQLDLFLDLAATSPVDLVFQARGDGLFSEDTVRVDVFRPSLSLKVTPVQERVEAGQPVTFNIDLTNTSDRPLSGAYVQAVGDESMIIQIENNDGTTATVREVERRKDGPLQPGETWAKAITLIPIQSGRRCVTVNAFADGGQRTSQTACVTVINPVPQTPALTANLTARDAAVIGGAPVLAKVRVVNNGRGPARNVKVTMAFDPQLQPIGATEGADSTRIGQNLITWTVPTIGPTEFVLLEAQFNAVSASPNSRIAISVESEEGARADTDLFIAITPTAAAPGAPTAPELPPAGPTPEVPGGAAPLRGDPRDLQPSAPPLPERTGQLRANLFERDDPVRVGDPIRYSLRITNDSNVRDGQVDIQFALPAGIIIEKIVPLTNPELGQYQVNAGVVALPYIGSMDPGESVDFELVLSSNQPQTFDLNVQIRSVNQPNGFVTSATTTVQ